jgi:hypothetical protein
VGYLVSLDNTPPLADLDPPNDFRVYKKAMDKFVCSWPFDPLGFDAVSDGQTVAQVFDIRARIEDLGNQPLSGYPDFTPIAAIDNNRVQLLVLDDTSQALVVDTNNDGVCDAVNPLLTPTTAPKSATDALLVNMVPINPAGNGDFRASPIPPPPTAPCIDGTELAGPEPICDTSNLLLAIAQHGTNLPAIYTIPPIVNDKLQNLGRQFDALGNSVSDGWICLAIAVWDKLGNGQVSRPLRVCVDKDGTGGECSGATPMPTCTGTQTVAKPKPIVNSAMPCRPWYPPLPHSYNAGYPPLEFQRL